MRRLIITIITAVLGVGTVSAGEDTASDGEPMTLERLQGIVEELADESRIEGRMMRFSYRGLRLMLLADPEHDRMRIITPIVEVSEVDDDQLRRCMEANFSTAADARYAVENGVLYSAYLHPLSSLTEEQVRSAVPQVATLAATFGSYYHSGHLRFQ